MPYLIMVAQQCLLNTELEHQVLLNSGLWGKGKLHAHDIDIQEKIIS